MTTMFLTYINLQNILYRTKTYAHMNICAHEHIRNYGTHIKVGLLNENSFVHILKVYGIGICM